PQRHRAGGRRISTSPIGSCPWPKLSSHSFPPPRRSASKALWGCPSGPGRLGAGGGLASRLTGAYGVLGLVHQLAGPQQASFVLFLPRERGNGGEELPALPFPVVLCHHLRFSGAKGGACLGVEQSAIWRDLGFHLLPNVRELGQQAHGEHPLGVKPCLC